MGSVSRLSVTTDMYFFLETSETCTAYYPKKTIRGWRSRLVYISICSYRGSPLFIHKTLILTCRLTREAFCRTFLLQNPLRRISVCKTPFRRLNCRLDDPYLISHPEKSDEVTIQKSYAITRKFQMVRNVGHSTLLVPVRTPGHLKSRCLKHVMSVDREAPLDPFSAVSTTSNMFWTFGKKKTK